MNHDEQIEVMRRAIKLLADQYANAELAGRRFTREARVAARLSGHHNVVTIYEQWQSGKQVTVWPQDQVGGPLQYPAKPFAQRETPFLL